MDIKKRRHLNQEQIKEYTEIFTQGHMKNDFVGNYLMDGNEKIIRKFMKIMVTFHNHHADFYEMRNDEGKIVAAIIYLPVGYQPLGVITALKRGKLLMIIKTICTQSIKITSRFIRFSDLESKSWGNEKYVFIDNVASLEKGCGKKLIENTIINYNKEKVALNSSVSKDDHRYYKQFGFKAKQEIIMDGHKTVMMVKDKQSS